MELVSASDPLELAEIRTRARTNFDVTADGQRFLVTVHAGSIETEGESASPRIHVILNWFEELKQRVLTGR